MTRRHRLIALVAAGATLFSGCGSTSRNDTVARVDGAELDQSTFERLVASGPESALEAQNPNDVLFAPTSDGEYPTTGVQSVINYWTWNVAFRAELTARDIEVPEPTAEQAGPLDALDADYRAAVNALMSVEVDREWSDAEVEQRFDDLICIDLAVIPPSIQGTDDAEAAKEFGRSVSSGASLLELAQQSGYAAQGVGCFRPEAVTSSVNRFLEPADTEVKQGLLEKLDQGAVLDPLYTEDYGYIVVHRPSVEGLTETDLVSLKEQAVIAEIAENHDVWVNPIYGWFSPLGVSSLSAGR